MSNLEDYYEKYNTGVEERNRPYINFVNNLDSETEVMNTETGLEEQDHNLIITYVNNEHPIVLEMDNLFDQDNINYFPNGGNEDEVEEKDNVFDENEFEVERIANIKINFAEYLEYEFVEESSGLF